MRIHELARLLKTSEDAIRKILTTKILNTEKKSKVIHILEDEKLEAVKRLATILKYEYRGKEKREKKREANQATVAEKIKEIMAENVKDKDSEPIPNDTKEKVKKPRKTKKKTSDAVVETSGEKTIIAEAKEIVVETETTKDVVPEVETAEKNQS